MKALKYLNRFLDQNQMEFEDLSAMRVMALRDYLMHVRCPRGIYKTPIWVVGVLKYIRFIYNDLIKKGYVQNNPMSPFHREQVLEELTQQFEARRENKRQEAKQISNGMLAKQFLAFCEKFQSNVMQIRNRLVLSMLESYCEGKGIHIKDLRKDHLPGLYDFIGKYEFTPSKMLGFKSFYRYMTGITKFYEWAYEEGYISHNPLAEVGQHSLEMIHEDIYRTTRKDKRPRYYSTDTIMLTYRKYIETHYLNHSTLHKRLSCMEIFIEYLKDRGKTFYTCTQEDAGEFENYIFNYHNHYGRCFTLKQQGLKIAGINKFYEWFVKQKYILKNPFRDFKKSRYIQAYRGQYTDSQAGGGHKEKLKFQKEYEGFMEREQIKGWVSETLKQRDRSIRFFLNYLGTVSVRSLSQLTEEHLMSYQSYLYKYRQSDESELSLNVKLKHLVTVKRFCKYLASFKIVNGDIGYIIELPNVKRGLPTTGMQNDEVLKFFKKEPVTDFEIRNRALMEVLYSTGIRNNELRNLKVEDISFSRGLLKVMFPKGGASKQRVVPIGREACKWVKTYLDKVRKKYSGQDWLFISGFGRQFCHSTILNIVKSGHMKTGIKKNIVTHSFRVSCATEMLRGKASIKHVQEQLGHSSIQSTEKYLRLVPDDLKKAHTESHPRK